MAPLPTKFVKYDGKYASRYAIKAQAVNCAVLPILYHRHMKGVIMMNTCTLNPSAEVLAQKKLFIFDMDGTIYLGKVIFDFAIRFITHLRQSGRQVLFFTNNASHATDFYVKKLTRLGFAPSSGEIMTSADVTVAYLKTRYPGQSIYLVGTEELAGLFREAGIPLLSGREERADLVVSSFDTELTYEKLDNACRLIRGGAVYLCTHPDLNCPTDTGFILDSGSIAAAITASTGVTPRYLGKPYAEVVDMIETVTGISRRDTCIFGDRLYTDIALGTRNGVTSVLVLTGETHKNDLLTAPADQRPDFVYDSLAEVDSALFGQDRAR